jgi:hypothetical protein
MISVPLIRERHRANTFLLPRRYELGQRVPGVYRDN